MRISDWRSDVCSSDLENVTAEGITVKLVSGEVRELQNGDKMLKRMDLAYAINTHMAQGSTNETVVSVMGARETNLSNARALLVNHTRQQNDVRLFTDDKDKLVAQIENNRGDKSSALEAIGELAVEKILSEKGKEFSPELPVDLKKQSDARSEERRGGKEGVRTSSSRGVTDH